MKKFRLFSALSLLLSSSFVFAQQGVHGPRTVNAANTIVNEYTQLTANASSGATSITVANSGLNTNGRFTNTLQPGDLIMIYQTQGAWIRNQFDVATPADTSWGRISTQGDYFNCGRYELRQVLSVPNATTINIDCGLTYTYAASGGAQRAQVIRVPRYTTLTINNGGVLTCDDWNGTIGGVLAVEVQGNVVVNAGGSIDATGKGFRGGSLVGDNTTTYGVNNAYSMNPDFGAEKGEGIVGYQTDYDVFGGRYGRGAPGNAGGGGDAHNAGGGGGSNAYNVAAGANVWRGLGVPDQTGPGWAAAWGLEYPILPTLTNANSQGGGKGGYTFSDQNQNATTLGPSSGSWGGDSRNKEACGLGGRPLDYTTGRLFMGGGGGAGDQNQSYGGNGGDGGGLIYMMVFGNISGAGSVVSNGAAGVNSQGAPPINSYSGRDGAGGGGGGGTIVLNAIGGVSGITATANGGNGGNQVMTAGPLYVGSILEAEGPGGGGGGGYIAVSSGAITRTTNGGNNGTTNSASLTEFTPNGATRGASGTNNASISNYNLTVNPVTICSGQTATLTATTTGTVPPGAVISWYTQSTGGTAIATGNTYTTPVLTATTTYYVGICPGWWRVPVTVTVNAIPNPTATATPATICVGQSTTLNASGATTYIWNGGSLVNASGASQTVSPATTTTYTVQASNGSCSANTTVTVVVNAVPTPTVTATPATICPGQNVTLNASGGTNYTWNGGSLVNANGASQTVNPATTTTYTVAVSNGTCSTNSTVTVNVTPAPTPTVTATPTNVCPGQTVTLSASGGTNYTWNGGSLVNANGASQSVTPAATTTYTVAVSNGLCSTNSTITVTVNPVPTPTVTASPATICSGQSVTLTAGGGTTYTWNGGSLTNASGASQTVSPTSNTTYTVTVSNGNCSANTTVSVTVNPTPTPTATASPNAICVGQSTTLTASGGSSYTWNGGSLTNATGASQTVSPTVNTTYTVTVSNGLCSSNATLTVTINPVPTPTVAATPATICAGQSTTLSASGGTSYVWNGGSLVNASGASQTVSPSANTTYTVIVANANCSVTSTVSVSVNPVPTPTAASTPTAICAGQSATLSATGGSSYTWNGGSLVNASGASQTVNPASTTTYTVAVSNGLCSANATITLTVNPLPVPVAVSTPPAICLGDTASLSVSGASAYVWNGGTLVNASGSSQQVNPSANTTYTVTATDVNGCSATTQLTVTVNPLPVANAGNDQAICEGNSAGILASGGTTYVWNGGALSNASGASQTVSPVTTTNYVVTVTDANGCSDNDTMQILVNPLPVVSAGNNVSICPNTSIQLNATGATTYSWSPTTGLNNPNIGNPTASPAVTTTYVVTGTSAAGCSSTDTIVVTISNNLTIFAGPDISICPGDTVQLATSGGTTYVWSPAASLSSPNSATTDAFPTSTTTYTVSVTDAFGCNGTDTVTVNVSPQITLTASGAATICIGQTANISASASGGSGTLNYSWSNSLTGPGPHTVSPVTTTTYSVTATDSIGCSSTQQTVTVTVNPPLALQSIAPAAVCAGGSVTITANGSGGDGNLNYNWLPVSQSGASVTLTPSATTTLTVILTDGCGTPADTQTVVVTVNQNPVVTLTSDVTSGCGPLCVNFFATSTSSCVTGLWQFGDGDTSLQSSPSHCYLSSGTYDVTYTCTDANGCVGSVTNTGLISVFPSPVAAFAASPNGTVETNTTVSLFDLSSNNPNVWSWTVTGPSGTTTSSNQNTSFVASDTGTYQITLIVANAQGCTDTAVTTVSVENPCGELFIPSAFSPNGDNNNDTLKIYGGCFDFIKLEVYSRWGEMVFSTVDPAKGWDGRWRGQPCEAGVFTYVLTGQLSNGTVINRQGNINLIR